MAESHRCRHSGMNQLTVTLLQNPCFQGPVGFGVDPVVSEWGTLGHVCRQF
jgi:hypothetical protein